LSISPSDLLGLQKSFKKTSVPVQVIGQVRRGLPKVWRKEGRRKREIKPLPRDEILKIYENT